MNEPIYLDYAATTPIDSRVLEKMLPFLTEKFGNAHSRDHQFGWDAADAVEEARYHVSRLVNTPPNHIFFTSGATEAINLVIKNAPTENGVARIVTTSVEHDAVLQACHWLRNNRNAKIAYVPINRIGEINLEHVRASIRTCSATLLVVMAANNEIGNVYPIQSLGMVAREHGVRFFCDASQAVGRIPIDMQVQEIDCLAFSSHKIYGPKGAGAVAVRTDGVLIEPLIHGGGQERNLRSGTLNVPAIVGFGEACRIAGETLLEDSRSQAALRDELERTILAAIPSAAINGDTSNRLPNLTSIRFPGVDARSIIRDMGIVAVSTKSSCSSSNNGPSKVLLALGHSENDALSSIRFSLGRRTTQEEISETAKRCVAAVSRLSDSP